MLDHRVDYVFWVGTVEAADCRLLDAFHSRFEVDSIRPFGNTSVEMHDCRAQRGVPIRLSPG